MKHKSLNHLAKSLAKSLRLERDNEEDSRPDTRPTLYHPLDRERKEIRLLSVKAGSGSQPLRCKLKRASLTARRQPKYETISYCWGDPKVTAEIILHEITTEIPASAEAALRRMRLPHDDRVLWIVAVCINQNDSMERGHQVGIMYEIYFNGSTNLVWLGEDDGTTGSALESISCVLRDAEMETDPFQRFRHASRGSYKLSAGSSQRLEIGDSDALQQFYARPWFRRAWVMQEVTLARSNRSFCGTFELPLKAVVRVAMWMRYNYLLLPFSFMDSRGLRNARMLFDSIDDEHGYYRPSKNRKATLLGLLRTLRGCETTDPRDQIYSLLGLYRGLGGVDRLPDSSVPDYKKPLPNVLGNATREVIEQSRDLSVLTELTRASAGGQYDRMWPSWIPCWHVAHNLNNDAVRLHGGYRAADGVSVDIRELAASRDPNFSSLTGFPLGSVTAAAPPMTEDSVKDVKGIGTLLRHIHSVMISEDISKDTLALGSTLVAGMNCERESPSVEDCLDFSVWSEYIRERDRFPPRLGQLYTSHEADHEDVWRAARHYQAFYSASKNRRYFTVSPGLIGIGPRDMHVGDTLVVLYGCPWPIVLRADHEDYNVVGVCYVYGIMFGEAVRKHKAEGNEDKVFSIC